MAGLRGYQIIKRPPFLPGSQGAMEPRASLEMAVALIGPSARDILHQNGLHSVQGHSGGLPTPPH